MHRHRSLAREGPWLPLPAQVAPVPGNFWRPNPEFLQELVGYLQGKKVLEVFAGNGYLAAQLSAHGVSVHPTTMFSGHDCHAAGCYCKVEELGAS